MTLTKSAKDRLYHLQRKYGSDDRALWPVVAREELSLPKSLIKRKDKREEFKEDLGLWQKVKTQKQPWFVNLEKLAAYLDKQSRMTA